jgi:hypothetical protein
MINLDPKTKKWLRLARKVFIVLFAVGILAWFFVISPYLTRQEKQRFESAASSLQKLKEELYLDIGKPSDELTTKECVYASAKFTKGSRSCSIKLSLLFVGIDFEESNKRMQIIEKKLGVGFLDRVRRGGELQEAFISPETESRQQRFGLTFSRDDCENCSLTLIYPNKPSYDNSFSNAPVESLVIDITYSAEARAEHYPVED